MTIRLSALGTFSTGIFDEGAAEIVAHDPATQRLFVINADANQIDVLDIADPGAPALVTSIDLLAALGDSAGGINSVAVNNGIVAAAVGNADGASPGVVAFLDTDGTILNTVTVGVLPDMVTFTPDGTRVLTANEGEPTDSVDPQGSVSIIDISGGVENATVSTADFSAFDGQEADLRDAGVRIFPGKSVSEDVEPEYIAVSPDGTTAWVTLQEANSVALVDIAAAEVTAIVPLGTKDHSVEGNGLDASNEDGAINIRTWPVQGLYMPDAIAAYEVAGEAYYITANEGDDRGEDVSIADVTLDPTAFPDAATLQAEDQLGALAISSIDGDLDGDGDFDQLLSYGSRSFTIWNSSGEVVFDSGDQFEQVTAADFPLDFNSTNDENDSFDDRSDNKGPEPEGVAIGQVGDSIYAFIGLERIGGIMVYDVTEPADAEFVQYLNNRDFRVEDVEASLTGEDPVGDLGPEGLAFISAEDSPTGVPLLAVGNEVSGTTTLYDIREADYSLQILHASDLEGGVEAIDNAPNFAAIVDLLEDEVANSLTLSAGDNVIPGPFFNAALFVDDQIFNDAHNAVFGLPDAGGAQYESLEGNRGRIDISIMNVIGFDASALGNHEFDTGTGTLAGFIEPDFGDTEALSDDEWIGTTFPYLSANLDFSANSDLGNLATTEIVDGSTYITGPIESEGGETTPRIAPAAVFEEGGERIGVVGATTPLLDTISSPGTVGVSPDGNDMQALAAILQPVVDEMVADGINKIVLVSHLQQIALEEELVGLLENVDIVIAGGSDTLLADREDEARGLQPGDEADRNYPVVTTNADGDPAVIVSTDGEYSYVGRLVVDFDADGVLIPGSVDPSVSGSFATTDDVVADLYGDADPFAEGSKGALTQDLVAAVDAVVSEQDGNTFGNTDVFLDGRRESVRTEETNLGNLTADANLALAQDVDDTVLVSLKNGGGIRAPIGETDMDGALLPPQANPDVGKEEGEVSQLDIVNALRFNNGLTLLTLSAEELAAIIEHGVAQSDPGSTPGRFPQVGGIRFSFDPDEPGLDAAEPGELSRLQNLAIVDEDGTVIDAVVQDGAFVGDQTRDIRIVTLDFLAGGGDGYRFDEFGENRVDLEDAGLADGTATFAPAGGEQDALAEFLAANFPDEATAFADPETAPAEDTRIQNLNERADGVFPEPDTDEAVLRYFNLEDEAHFYTADPAEQDEFAANDSFAFEGEAFDNFEDDPGASPVFRFFNTDTGGYFYTISEGERDLVLDTLPQYELQGSSFDAFEAAASEEVSSIFRFFNTDAGAHFYTASAEERDLVIATLPQFEFEGTAFFA